MAAPVPDSTSLDIVQRLLNGESMASIGADYGYSRAGVRVKAFQLFTLLSEKCLDVSPPMIRSLKTVIASSDSIRAALEELLDGSCYERTLDELGLEAPIESLDISTLAKNVTLRSGVRTLGGLLQATRDDLYYTFGFGPGTEEELRDYIERTRQQLDDLHG